MQIFIKIFLSLGIILAALICYRKHLPLPVVLVFSFGSWAGAALIHQWFIK